MKSLKVVTLIPARGGSKGIPRKNIISLGGKPLIAYTIEASLNSHSNETWVSTDDDEIADIANSYGSKVIKRPKYLAKDTATSEATLLHFSEKYDDFDILIFLQATCPFVKKEDINNALILMKKYDSVITVSKLDQFLWQGNKAMYDINNRKRRQKREQTYLETGSMFVTTKLGLEKSKNRISGKIGFVEVSKWRSLDIDTLEDLDLARRLIRVKNKKFL
jgi:N-acylneuraminate cytidylyltransferase|tara:strand:- start:1020 stop:1679 length:660 start_codon:yes stop_codon:yes gene_type:complete